MARKTTKPNDDCYNIGFARNHRTGKLEIRFVHRLSAPDKNSVREWKTGSDAKAKKLLRELLAQ